MLRPVSRSRILLRAFASAGAVQLLLGAVTPAAAAEANYVIRILNDTPGPIAVSLNKNSGKCVQFMDSGVPTRTFNIQPADALAVGFWRGSGCGPFGELEINAWGQYLPNKSEAPRDIQRVTFDEVGTIHRTAPFARYDSWMEPPVNVMDSTVEFEFHIQTGRQ